MKTTDKLAREWQRMTIAECTDGQFPPRICKELIKFSFLSVTGMQDIERSHFIWGKAGTGKTLYAAALMYEILRRNYCEGRVLTMKFITFDDILLEIRHIFNTTGTITESQVIEKYRRADWLVLDDFGIHKQSDWTYQVLYSIINYRYEHLKPVIITSNFSLMDLAAKLDDDRVVSRLSVMCRSQRMDQIKRKKP